MKFWLLLLIFDDTIKVQISLPDDTVRTVYRSESVGMNCNIGSALFYLGCTDTDYQDISPYDLFMELANYYDLAQYRVLVQGQSYPEIRTIKVQPEA